LRIIIYFLFFSFLYSNEYEIELYKEVFNSLFSKKVKVYSDREIALNLVKDCLRADILLIYDIKNIPKKCTNKPLFVTNYKDFLNTKAIGAFYWRKGRPQLKFKIKTILKYNLNLPDALKEYAQ